MGKYRIDISEPAENDLRDIARYSAQVSTSIIVFKIMEAIEALTDMPQVCAPITDEHLTVMGYRKLIVKNYIVFFTINENDKLVDVVRILHMRRDWIHIL